MIAVLWTVAVAGTVVYGVFVGLSGELARAFGGGFAVLFVLSWIALVVLHAIGDMHDRADR